MAKLTREDLRRAIIREMIYNELFYLDEVTRLTRRYLREPILKRNQVKKQARKWFL